MKTSNLFTIILLSILFTPFFYCFAFAKDSVSIIMYHRFGESNYPSTNIQLDRFKEHLEELKNPKYKVMHLSTIIENIKTGRELPEFTVAITIDDAFMSVYKEGWPLLKEYNFPFTILNVIPEVFRSIGKMRLFILYKYTLVPIFGLIIIV